MFLRVCFYLREGNPSHFLRVYFSARGKPIFVKPVLPLALFFEGLLFFLREGNRFCKICSPSRALLSLKLHYFIFIYPLFLFAFFEQGD